MIDCETNEAWSKSLKRKDDVPEAGLNFTDELVGMGKGPPGFIGMDRASENKRMAELTKRKCPEIKKECTSNDMPQQNGKVERLIATMWNRVRTMLDGAGSRGKKKRMLWGEAWVLAVDWWNVTIETGKEKCPEEKWSGVVLRWTRDKTAVGAACVDELEVQRLDFCGF